MYRHDFDPVILKLPVQVSCRRLVLFLLLNWPIVVLYSTSFTLKMVKRLLVHVSWMILTCHCRTRRTRVLTLKDWSPAQNGGSSCAVIRSQPWTRKSLAGFVTCGFWESGLGAGRSAEKTSVVQVLFSPCTDFFFVSEHLLWISHIDLYYEKQSSYLFRILFFYFYYVKEQISSR